MNIGKSNGLSIAEVLEKAKSQSDSNLKVGTKSLGCLYEQNNKRKSVIVVCLLNYDYANQSRGFLAFL